MYIRPVRRIARRRQREPGSDRLGPTGHHDAAPANTTLTHVVIRPSLVTDED
jgi:hypothetical protein